MRANLFLSYQYIPWCCHISFAQNVPLVHLVVKITLSVTCNLCQSPVSKTLIRLAVYYCSLIMCYFQNSDLQNVSFDRCYLPPLTSLLWGCPELWPPAALLFSQKPGAMPTTLSFPPSFLLEAMGLVSAAFSPPVFGKRSYCFLHSLFPNSFIEI